MSEMETGCRTPERSSKCPNDNATMQNKILYVRYQLGLQQKHPLITPLKTKHVGNDFDVPGTREQFVTLRCIFFKRKLSCISFHLNMLKMPIDLIKIKSHTYSNDLKVFMLYS